MFTFLGARSACNFYVDAGAGAFSALAWMTGISVIIGQIFHSVPTSLTGGLPLDDYVAIASFVYFGVKLIKDALYSNVDDGLELELKSAEEELAHVPTSSILLYDALPMMIHRAGKEMSSNGLVATRWPLLDRHLRLQWLLKLVTDPRFPRLPSQLPRTLLLSPAAR